MKYNPEIHHRKSIRMKGYDYSQEGLYYITMCVQKRECLFGEIKNDEMILNDAGRMIENEWLAITKRFSDTELHEYCVMPNHFHGILEIVHHKPVDNDTVANGQPGIASTTGDNDTGNSVGAPLVGVLDNAGVTNPPNDDIIANAEPQTKGEPPTEQREGNHKGLPQPGIAPTSDATIKKTVGDMMDAFKSISTVEYIRGVENEGWQTFYGKLWQRNYYEHIIRNHESYLRTANYIVNNPANWQGDEFYKE